jgi:hypothetical protein
MMYRPRMRKLLSGLVVMLAVSTAYGEAPAPKTEEISAADAAKLEKFVDAWIDVMVKNTADCPKMGKGMNALLDTHEAWLTKIAESGKEVPPAMKEKFKKKGGDMMNALMKCKDDKTVTGAMERFGAIDKKRKKAPESKPAEAKPEPKK